MLSKKRTFYSTTRISLPRFLPEQEYVDMNGFAWSPDFGLLLTANTSGETLVEALRQLSSSGASVASSSTVDKWSSSGGLVPPSTIDNLWMSRVGRRDAPLFPPGITRAPEFFSGFVPDSELLDTRIMSEAGLVKLRPDAARALMGLHETIMTKHIISPSDVWITRHYMSYDEQRAIIADMIAARKGKVTSDICTRVRCPAGSSDHGWGIAIDIRHDLFAQVKDIMAQFGWVHDPTGDGGEFAPHFVFIGNADAGWPAYLDPSEPSTYSVRTGGTYDIGAFPGIQLPPPEPVIRFAGGRETLLFKVLAELESAKEALTFAQLGIRLNASEEDIEAIAQVLVRTGAVSTSTSKGSTVIFKPPTSSGKKSLSSKSRRTFKKKKGDK